MKALTVSIIGILLLACAGPACGHEGSGGMSLEPRPSVRALAMGETGLLGTGDAAAFTANPATLTWITGAGVTLSHETLVEGVSASATSVCAAAPLGSVVTLPDLGQVGHRFGLGFGLDHSGVELSQGTDWGWDLVSVGAAYRLAPYASAGLTGKYLLSNSDLDGSAVQAFAFDIGAFVEMTPALGFAVSLRNVAGTASWEHGDDESPPFAAGLGTSLSLPSGVSGRLAYTFSGGAPGKLVLGADVPVAMTGLSLRAGYVYYSGDYSRNIITAGVGFAYSTFEVDYAVKLDDDLALGTTHHFSLGFMLR